MSRSAAPPSIASASRASVFRSSGLPGPWWRSRPASPAPGRPAGHRLLTLRAMPLLEVSDLKKSFWAPDGTRCTVIDVPRFALDERAQVALQGESGLGKTTLLYLIAGILKPDSGRIWLAGQDLTALDEARRDRVRAMSLGYIFQTFNLLPAFTCLENVLLGMSFGPGSDRSFAKALLERVGLGGRLGHRPRQLSTGQQQRVAVARALANRPRLVLADEPTGNLDSQTSREIMELLRSLNASQGLTVVIVTHEPDVAAFTDRLVVMRDGRIAADGPSGGREVRP